ncbi:hypothetical protein TWF730_002486 [Orbilia blumenaviensis]|uniref:Uncharacterized protein n=1 Tax=Orbilia blumenaviensis TaxID=1796055 RepID=A0AAV9UAV8_9PEZI
MQFSILAVATLLLSLAQATPVPQDDRIESPLGKHNCFAAVSNGTPNPYIETKPPAGGINPDAWCTSTCMLCNAGADAQEEACSQVKKFCQDY